MTLRRLAPLSGVLAVALVVAAFAVGGEPPDADASIDEVTSFYTENEDEVVLGSLLLAAGSAFFLFFASSLRTAFRRAETDSGASALSFGGAIVYVVGMSIFAGIGFSVGDTAKDIEPAALQTLHVLNLNMWPTLAVGALVFLVGSGVAVLKTGVFPRWLGWAVIIAGLCVFTPAWFVPFLGIGLFTLITSVMLFLRGGTESAST